MPSELIVESGSVDTTRQLAAICAEALHCGMTFALNGQLGSGKTLFVRAFCEALGVDSSSVSSPTFVLMQLYEGTDWAISHFDTYRLGDPDEFLALGAEEYLHDPQVISLIEWAERVQDLLPADHVAIGFEQTGQEARCLTITCHGADGMLWLDDVRCKLEQR